MRHLRRLRQRPRPSKATHILCSGLLALTGGVPAAAAASAGGACKGATVTREYTVESMTYRLHLDLDGCRWWDGSPRNLVIWLNRDDGAGAASRYSMAACGSGSDPAARTTACEVFAALPHPAGEQLVTYQGEATWEWKDGTHRASFETRCASHPAGDAGCEDPVDTWYD